MLNVPPHSYPISFPFRSFTFSILSLSFLFLASLPIVSSVIHTSRSFLSALLEVSGKWTERYPTRLMPATLHCANNSGATRNAYMSCTRLLCCQLRARALDRQEQENKTPLILPQLRHIHKQADRQGCFQSPVKSVSVSKREQGQRGEHFSSHNLEGIVLIR